MRKRNTVPRAFFPALFLMLAYRAHAVQDIDPDIFLHRPEVKAAIAYFTGAEKKTWLESAFDRGIIYNDYVCRKIDEYSLPQALKFLPVIESGCNPDAVSPSGAAGLWQFMLNSIEPYDLQVNEWIDERRDFWKSTIAGLRKLQYNQSVLGDWLLAIAAYNCGLNRMKLALEESTSRDFWELVENGYLPEETATYVPKFLAVVHIARNAHAYGLQLPAATGWEWVRIRLNGQLNLRLFTRNAEIPLDILALGNAELRHDVTPPAEHAYHLKVPDIYSDVIHRLLENAQMLNRYYVHDIQPGDTLYALARVYGVSMDTIKEHNPGIEPRFLQVNAKLIIPAVKEIP